MKPRLARILLVGVAAFAGCSLLGQQGPPNRSANARQTARVKVDPDVAADLLEKNLTPRYPAEAQNKGIQGVVKLKILISRSGDVTQAILISGHPMLAQAAIDAVKQWKYKPYVQDGKAVSIETAVSVAFPPGSAAGADVEPPNVKFTPTPDQGPQSGTVVGIIKRRADGTKFASLSSEFAQTLLLKKIPPKYPEAARELHDGTVEVVLKGLISKEGDVIDVQLISGPPVFVQPAIDAVKQWKYKPYLPNGQAMEFETEITVNFTPPPVEGIRSR
jgi:TonB family protein